MQFPERLEDTPFTKYYVQNVAKIYMLHLSMDTVI